LEEISNSNLQVHPLFYYRYVDDIILALPSESTLTILLLFLILYIQGYNLSWRLAMTIDWIFLISFDYWQFFTITIKELFSIHITQLHFREDFWISNHPLCHKRGIIINFIDKIFLLSHPRFQHNNLVETIHIFLNNGYPLPFIFSTIEN